MKTASTLLLLSIAISLTCCYSLEYQVNFFQNPQYVIQNGPQLISYSDFFAQDYFSFNPQTSQSTQILKEKQCFDIYINSQNNLFCYSNVEPYLQFSIQDNFTQVKNVTCDSNYGFSKNLHSNDILGRIYRGLDQDASNVTLFNTITGECMDQVSKPENIMTGVLVPNKLIYLLANTNASTSDVYSYDLSSKAETLIKSLEFGAYSNIVPINDSNVFIINEFITDSWLPLTADGNLGKPSLVCTDEVQVFDNKLYCIEAFEENQITRTLGVYVIDEELNFVKQQEFTVSIEINIINPYLIDGQIWVYSYANILKIDQQTLELKDIIGLAEFEVYPEFQLQNGSYIHILTNGYTLKHQDKSLDAFIPMGVSLASVAKDRVFTLNLYHESAFCNYTVYYRNTSRIVTVPLKDCVKRALDSFILAVEELGDDNYAFYIRSNSVIYKLSPLEEGPLKLEGKYDTSYTTGYVNDGFIRIVAQEAEKIHAKVDVYDIDTKNGSLIKQEQILGEYVTKVSDDEALIIINEVLATEIHDFDMNKLEKKATKRTVLTNAVEFAKIGSNYLILREDGNVFVVPEDGSYKSIDAWIFMLSNIESSINEGEVLLETFNRGFEASAFFNLGSYQGEKDMELEKLFLEIY